MKCRKNRYQVKALIMLATVPFIIVVVALIFAGMITLR